MIQGMVPCSTALSTTHPFQRASLLALMATCLAMMILPGRAHAITQPFFARQQVSSSDLSAFTKWTDLLPRYDEEQAEALEECDEDAETPCMAEQWEALIKKLDGQSRQKQMQAINRFFNQVTYINDIDNWGTDDYWATPHEFMRRGGDCEDYAIAKYISLKRLGWDEQDMRIMIVQDQNLNGQMHAILEVKLGGMAYILDNQATQVIRAAKIYHYQPIYAINETAWWAYL